MANRSAEQKTFIAPDNYRKLCEPFPSAAAADEALDAFWLELYELRNKHKIPDLSVVAAVSATAESGEATLMVDVHIGDQLRKESMLAWAFGQAQSERQAEIGRLVSGAVKAGRDRR